MAVLTRIHDFPPQGGGAGSTPEVGSLSRKPMEGQGDYRGLQPPGRELDYGWERAMLGPVTSSSTSRTAQAEVSLGTIALSLAALSMALFAYFF